MILTIIYFTFFCLLFSYIAGILYLKRGFNKECDMVENFNPSVSIVVSFHNEEKNARTCIEKLLAQNYPHDRIQIILIDDRSVDNTKLILHEYAEKYTHIEMITIENISPDIAPKKRAIDTALKIATGDIIFLTDADGRPGPLWLRSMVSYFKENIGMVIGYAPYITCMPYNHFIYKLLALEYLSHAAVAASSSGIGFPLTCVGTNMAYRKTIYNQLNGFGQFAPVPSGDDDLFLQRVRDETDWDICYAGIAESHVSNAPPTSWAQFYHQRLRYASKGFFYPWNVSLSLVAFFLLNLLFLLLPILSLWYPQTLYLVLLGLVLKGSVEYIFLKQAVDFLKAIWQVHLFPIAFILHIPYVVIFGFLTQLQSYQWAGTKH
jgi:cellulose synthase/poly-beta-1,6-N-acetylglucosamine synthase-like glycosyltransferase